MSASSLSAVLLVLLAGLQLATALSWPLCDSVGSTWVSATPHLSGRYPYYSQLFFCTGNLNLEGSGVDACLHNGQDCGMPAAHAFCQYAGYDGAMEDTLTVVEATEPVRAVTGEWCLSPGVYSTAEATRPAKLEYSPEANTPFCSRIDALVCYRERSTLAKTLAALRGLGSVTTPAPAPALARDQVVVTAALQDAAPSLPLAPRVPLRADAAAQGVATAGRRLRW